MAGLHFPITADNGSFMRALNEVTAGVRDASRQIEAEGGSIDRVISNIKNGIAGIGAGWGFKEVASAIASTRGEFQQLEVAFETMLGSAGKAAELMDQLVHTAAITPFDLQGIAEGAKQLLAYGVSADDVNHRLVQLGDIAAGLSIPLKDLVYLYGTTLTQGRMFTQDLRQFQGRGIPIADELAKQFGVAKDKVGELVTAGKVGSKEFITAIDAMTGPGSKFGGLMEAQSKTISGQIANIEDAFDSMLNDIGKSSEGLIDTTLGVTSTIVENWQTVLLILGDIAAAYGVQKAVTVGASAIATASFKAEATALAALLPTKQESIHLDIAEAVSKGKITEATAAKVIAMRKEVESYLKELAAQKAAAAEEATLAAQKYRNALQQSIAAKAAVTAKREELVASGQICGAYISENAVKEMGIVTDKAKQASLQSLAAKQEYNAAMSKKKAAAEALDTASTNVNTTSQTINARSTNILTVAKEGLVATTKKLYATMMAHPYALIAAAVLALGYGIYKLVTYQSEEEKRANAVSEAHAKCMAEYAKEKKELTSLANTLATAKKGSEEWKSAKDSIVSQYGQYFKNLDAEIEKVGNLSTSYGALTREIKKSIVAKQLKAYDEDEDHQVDIASTLKNSLNRISTGYMIYNPDTRKNERRVASKELQMQWQDQLSSYLMNGGEGELDPTLVKALKNAKSTWYGGHHSVWDEVEEDVKKIKANNADKEKIANSVGLTLEEVFKQETYDNVKTENLQKVYDEASKRYKAASQKVAEMKKNRSAYTNIQWDEAQSELKEAKEAYEKAGGETKAANSSGSTAAQLEAKEENAAGKLADTIRKQGQERLRIEQDYEYERWQNRIDMMQEGEAKVIAQQNLNFAKQKTDLQRRLDSELESELNRQIAVFDAEQDMLAAADKKYAKKTFRDSDIDESAMNAIRARYKALEEDLDNSQKKAESDRLQAAKESFNSYLQEFGNYQQKRKAIEADYDKRIGAAANTGDRMMLEAQKSKALSDLDYQQWIDSGEVALAFGDVASLSKETISRLISDMEQYREKVVATFDPEKIAKYQDALDNLRKAEVEDTFSAFGDMVPEYFTKRLALQKQINDELKIGEELTRKQNELTKQTQSKRQTVKVLATSQGYNLSDEDLADPKKIQNIADSIGSSANSGNVLTRALHSALLELLQLNEESTKLDDEIARWDGNFAHLKETLDNLEGEEKFNAICEAVGKAAGLVGSLAGQASEMAKALGAEGLGDALGYLGDAMGSVQNIANGFANGGLIGGIAAVAGEAMSWVTKIAMAGDAKHQKNIERLQERIDALQKSYDKLGKAVDDAYSTDASGLIEQQNALLEQQKVLINQQIAEEEAKKNTDDEKIKEWREQLEEIDEQIEENKKSAKEAIIGEDIKSAIDEFASAYIEAWEDGTDAAKKSMQVVKSIINSALTELLKKDIQEYTQQFYDALAEAMEDGILSNWELSKLDAIKALIDAAAAKDEELYNKIQERYKDLDELWEGLTDISFDSVRDNFKSLLTDMESSTEDFTDSFTDMLRNALIEGLMDSKYDALLKEWYEEFAEAMDDQKLTDEERERLRQQYQAIVDQGIADRNAVNSIVGGGAYSQQASEGESWGMNQETGEELNGRFTAMVELEATNNLLVSDGNTIARDILATLRSLTGLSMAVTGNGDNETMLAIKDMMFLSTGYLENIEKYSKNLTVMATDISEMKDAIKKL